MVSPEQHQIFTNAMSNLPMETVAVYIASVVIMTFFLWSAWNVAGQGRSWADNKIDLFQLIFGVLRVAFVLTLVGFWVQP